MSRGSQWTNNDGVVVGFGTHTADNEIPAVTAGAGSVKTMTMVVNLADLEDTDLITVASIDARATVIPRGSVIKAATVQMTVAATSGGSATLDIGFYDADTSSITVDDANGIDVDIALTAIDAVGDIVICDGALVNGVTPAGTTSNSDVVVVAGFEAAVFTAGQAIITVEFIPPAVIARTIDA